MRFKNIFHVMGISLITTLGYSQGNYQAVGINTNLGLFNLPGVTNIVQSQINTTLVPVTNSLQSQINNNSNIVTTLSTNIPSIQNVLAAGNVSTVGMTIDSANTQTNTYGGLLTILGSRVQSGTQSIASGLNSHAEGYRTTSSGISGHSEGGYTIASGAQSHDEGSQSAASGLCSHAAGAAAIASNYCCWVWNGDWTNSNYHSQFDGSFNINPVGGLYGFYIGTTSLGTTLNTVARIDWHGKPVDVILESHKTDDLLRMWDNGDYWYRKIEKKP